MFELICFTTNSNMELKSTSIRMTKRNQHESDTKTGFPLKGY
jgi:hypothetical protein